jgi:hypothetical protein
MRAVEPGQEQYRRKSVSENARLRRAKERDRNYARRLEPRGAKVLIPREESFTREIWQMPSVMESMLWTAIPRPYRSPSAERLCESG